MDDLFLVVGLGNPGNRYDNTKHNVGFETIDLLAEKHNIRVSKLKHKALYGDGTIEGKKVILAKPQTFMNLSGESVREMADWYKLPMKNIILIYDDIDLQLGKIRVRPKGSAGTHNGMRSILYQLQSEDFPRIRIGIGRPPEGWDLADYVLSKFNADERKTISESVVQAAEAVSVIIKSGAEAAMNKCNK
ncbi:MAG: aminoacyl-tRNA hydrolase [Clostridia bacterium]|nr:aminoacyl-tRNA hydrolase [Clostridia bacterium]